VTLNKPARLRPGSRIGVVAPAGCVERDALFAGIEVIRNQGYEVELPARILESKGYLAGDERCRADDLISFFQRDDINAIFCARGGFGSAQILPYLMVANFSPDPKIFAGYSDITILLNWLSRRLGMVTFHAPMVAMELAHGLTSRSEEAFWGLLTGKKSQWRVELGEVIRPGRAEGEMMGGCLSVVVTTLGTPYEIETDGKLLFLEDVGERPYRIERMLTHLKMARKLDRLAGLVFGDFANCEGEGSRSVLQIIGEMFAQASYPVVTGMPTGHGSEHITLPFGVRMMLDGNAGALSLLESPVI
jgi:muramoyltetrapeptide carboxypeptidase